MLLEFVTVCALVSPWDLHDLELNDWSQYINIQLKNQYSLVNNKVVFEADIPQQVHGHIRQMADESGWYVSIEKANGFYIWQTNTYKFTFTPK